jgi:enolase
MSHQVAQVLVRSILDSRGRPTVEAEVRLSTGAAGTGSSPVAIAPGRLEARRSTAAALGRWDRVRSRPIEAALVGEAFAGQSELDDRLRALDDRDRVGAGVTLALSLAFARAAAQAGGRSLVLHLAGLAGTSPRMPGALVNVFSGGIHDDSRGLPFQEVMVLRRGEPWATMTGRIVELAELVERSLAAAGRRAIVASAGGLVVERSTWDELLDLLDRAAELTGGRGAWPLGIDVAAEHLRQADGRYRLWGQHLTAAELAERLATLVGSRGIAYLEDPFDPDDEAAWRTLTPRLAGRCLVIGDDLFATQATRLRPGLATGMVVKLSQNGTVSGTLQAACRARELGMALTVSHRSGETEDCGMCDLAVALGADHIKLGGPRRERLAKYNRLIRLEEEVG